MIQSGRNVSLDNHTRLTICNTKESFVRNSTRLSMVRIANDGDEMCFSYAFALALSKDQRDKDPGNS